MEELVAKIGEMLDQKLEEKLVAKFEEMLDEKLEEKLVAKFEEMLDQKLEEKLVVKIEEMLDEKLEEKLNEKLDEKLGILEYKLEQKITEDIEKLRKEMLDQFFLFEQEYGDKIVSMGDYILVDKDKNEIRNKQVTQLENRVERLEVKSLVYENDILMIFSSYNIKCDEKIHKRNLVMNFKNKRRAYLLFLN